MPANSRHIAYGVSGARMPHPEIHMDYVRSILRGYFDGLSQAFAHRSRTVWARVHGSIRQVAYPGLW